VRAAHRALPFPGRFREVTDPLDTHRRDGHIELRSLNRVA